MARYEINYLTGDTDIVTNGAGHEWTTGLLCITDTAKRTILLAPTANVRSVLIHDEKAVAN